MPESLIRTLRAFAGAVVCAFLFACGGESSSGQSPGPAPTGTVSGTVVSAATGVALAGVTVTGGGQTATTTSTGTFSLTGVGTGDNVVLRFSLGSYATSFRGVKVAANATATANARLTPVGVTQAISAIAGGTVALPQGPAQVTLPANGLVDKSGVAATGQVSVAIAAIDPSADASNMPGGYSARAASGGAQTIESFGAISVTLSDSAGNALALASGQTATIRIPLASRSATPPATIPLYYFDESAGVWVEQGTATLGGTAPNQYYEGSVSHFTYWNADRPADTIYVHGCVKDSAGAASGGATVSADGVDYSGGSIAFADASGNFVVPIRKGGVADLYASTSTGLSNVVVVGPSDTDIFLPSCLVLGPPGPPVIVQQPTPATTQEGSYAQFTVVAIGSPPLRYQWLRNGTPIGTGLTSELFVLPASAADNGARYSVIVSNDYGSVTSDVVALTVAVLPPGLVNGPQSQTVTLGATATFSVQTSQPASLLTFQWNRNGAPIAGANAATYTTPATTSANDGDRYSVTLTNSAGTITSPEATLHVQVPTAPSITQNPASTSVTTGQVALFQVVASGSAPLTYQWSRNGAAIANATSASYATPPTVLADNGAVFSVTVTNAVGSATSTPATLTVADASFAPSIVQQPQGVSALVGQTATFSVTASGTAPLSYQWLRNGSEITGATASAYTTPALVLGDSGASFTVRVTNAKGSVTSAAAVLTVSAATTAPSITSQPNSTSVVAGMTATFSVVANGTAPLAYQWQRDGAAISGATGAAYTTGVLAVADSGAVFSVVVTNSAGSVTSSGATLTVTSSQTGAGRYLVAAAGPSTLAPIVYANGSQSVDSPAILAAAAVSPTSTSVVEPAGQATALFGQVFAGTVAGGQVTDLRTRYSLYFKGTHLYSIDHQPASGTPQGTQLSTLSPADVCAAGSVPDVADAYGSDLSDPTRNWVFFAAPVAGACASPSDSYRAVRIGMAATDAPVSIGQPVATLYDNSAAITGYIVRVGATFEKVDANLGNPQVLFTLTPSAFRSFGVSYGASAPGVWMFFNAGQLFAYDLATTASAPTAVATLQSGEQVGNVLSDGASAYVSITSGLVNPGFRILRVSDTLVATAVYTNTSASLTQFALTPTRIVMVTSAGSMVPLGSAVISVLRDGTGLLDVGGGSGGYLSVFAVTAAENVYLYEFTLDASMQPNGVRTRIIASDGSNAQTLPNTAMIGVLQAASMPLVPTLMAMPYGVMLVDNAASDGTTSGGTVRSLAGATRAVLQTYGSVQASPAASFFGATVDPLQYGQPGLWAFTPTAGSSDLYFIDSDTAGSLTKLTTYVSPAATKTKAATVRAPGSRSGHAPSPAAIRRQLAAQQAASRR